jgi:hypothetical protein
MGGELRITFDPAPADAVGIIVVDMFGPTKPAYASTEFARDPNPAYEASAVVAGTYSGGVYTLTEDELGFSFPDFPPEVAWDSEEERLEWLGGIAYLLQTDGPEWIHEETQGVTVGISFDYVYPDGATQNIGAGTILCGAYWY